MVYGVQHHLRNVQACLHDGKYITITFMGTQLCPMRVISTLKLFTPTQPACTDVLTHTHTNTHYTHTNYSNSYIPPQGVRVMHCPRHSTCSCPCAAPSFHSQRAAHSGCTPVGWKGGGGKGKETTQKIKIVWQLACKQHLNAPTPQEHSSPSFCL